MTGARAQHHLLECSEEKTSLCLFHGSLDPEMQRIWKSVCPTPLVYLPGLCSWVPFPSMMGSRLSGWDETLTQSLGRSSIKHRTFKRMHWLQKMVELGQISAPSLIFRA